MIKTITSPEFAPYDQLCSEYPSYSQYLETTDGQYYITTNHEVSDTELRQIDSGFTLLNINASSTSTKVYRYTPDGCFNFLTGGWVWEAKRPPIDWGEVGQKLIDTGSRCWSDNNGNFRYGDIWSLCFLRDFFTTNRNSRAILLRTYSRWLLSSIRRKNIN